MKGSFNLFLLLIAGIIGIISAANHAHPPQVYAGNIAENFTPTSPPNGMNTSSVPTINERPAADASAQGPTPIRGYIQNNCRFSIWVASVCCDPRCEFKLEQLRPGTGYWNPYLTYNNGCSQTIKLYRAPQDVAIRREYQVEYSMELNGDVWYNLSHEDGNPFTFAARFLTVDERCMWLYCAAENDGYECDWPRFTARCHLQRDVRFYLC
ncbi:hypothetical protein P154DRAFT_609305 [Amniculicola lignicola CBS 123094]|uniref:Uncharacterized protein n=1 Tax=Amniculicola lignicola CBS 123094 TaxID=1392246 RepID=A0A6A5W2Z3_9PLEO|nr:hypothetical protein P154DRAFT_609305 [Amniculicola lignicola CBS 123094]